MKPQNRTELVALVLRVLLGLWFAYTGGLKLFVTGLDGFTRDVANYQLVGAPFDALIAYAVPWFEIMAGLCLMLGILRRGALIILFALVAAFSVAIGWAWWHQLDISCGCLGSDAPIRYWAKTLELGSYFIVLGWLWWVESRHDGPAAPQKVQNMA